MTPEKLGPFRIGRVLGRGGMGTVYEGTSELDGTVIAIKVLSDFLDEEEDAEVRLRFESEIETLKRLRHPNIVQLSGFGEEEGQLYYVMELVNGASLQQELKKKRVFQWVEAAKIGLDICQALRHAHDRGVIHRDIKPANILLDQEGNVKLSDFGIARFFGAQQITDIHSIIGTLEYMSPEQALAHPINAGVDLYSLGCVLYVLLTGKPPYTAHSLPEMLRKYKSTTPAPLNSFRNDVPDDLGYLITDLLQIRPEKRPRNAQLIIKRLQALLQALAGDPDTIKVQPLPDTRKRPHELLFPAAGSSSNVNVSPGSSIQQEKPPENALPPGNVDPPVTTIKAVKSFDILPDQLEEHEIDERLLETRSASTDWEIPQAPLGERSSPPLPAEDQEESASSLRETSSKVQKTVTRFVAVESKPLDPFEEEHRVSRPVVSLPVAVTSTMLLIIGLTVYYLIQPASPEVLFEQIAATIKEDDTSNEYSLTLLRSTQKKVDNFLSTYPDHPSAEQVRHYQDELDLLAHERRLERRANFSGLRSLSPVERAYVEVLTSFPNDSEEMIIKLEAFIDVFQTGEPSSTEPVRMHRAASNPVEVCVELARRRLKKLKQVVEEINAEQKQVLQRRLEEAVSWDSIYPSHADDIRRGIIELYQHHRWAKDIVEEARQQLKE